MEDDIRAERLRALVEMLSSEGWRHVARPALLAHMNQIARTLAVSRNAELETIRGLQAEFAVLSRLLEKPKSFFMPGSRRQEETDAAMDAGVQPRP